MQSRLTAFDSEAQQAVLSHCRARGIWIFADDAYERQYYAGNHVAPSFLDIAGADDRVISTNTFSKAWCMTGWRLGWLVAPAAAVPELEKLAQNLFINRCMLSNDLL